MFFSHCDRPYSCTLQFHDVHSFCAIGRRKMLLCTVFVNAHRLILYYAHLHLRLYRSLMLLYVMHDGPRKPSTTTCYLFAGVLEAYSKCAKRSLAYFKVDVASDIDHACRILQRRTRWTLETIHIIAEHNHVVTTRSLRRHGKWYAASLHFNEGAEALRSF